MFVLGSIKTKALWIILAVLLAFGAWQLFSIVQVSAFNVKAQVKEPPKIDKIDNNKTELKEPLKTDDEKTQDKEPSKTDNEKTQGKEPPKTDNETNNEKQGHSSIVKVGGKKNVIYINSDIDYGDVFPGEEVTGHFTVYLQENVPDVYYTVNMTASDSGMSNYLVTQRHYGVGDDEHNEPDDVANGLNGDFKAEGYLNSHDGDIYDEWWVTFYVPDMTGDYNTQILVSPLDKTNVPDTSVGHDVKRKD